MPKPFLVPKPKPTPKPPPRKRPQDLLKLTSTPIHPFDLAHNLDTSGLVPAGNLLTGHPNDAFVTAYYGVAPSILRTLINHWRETIPPHPIHSYTFLDIGAGKGRAMLVASELPFHKIIGIELNPAMADIAERNLSLWREAHAADPTAPPLAPIQLYEQDALTFDIPSKPPSSSSSSAASKPSSPAAATPSTFSTSTPSAAPSSTNIPPSPASSSAP
jgi:SAM-dependent methyltransferase